MSHSIEQGARMVKAARATRQIVQVGMQRRSSPAVQAAKKAVDDGVLGDIVLARAQWFWNQPPLPKSVELEGKLDWDRFQAPCKHKRPADPVRWRVWRNFWDYSGGHCTDQGTHLMDVIQWFANDGGPPSAAECHGATYNLIGAEVPDTFCAVFEYPKFVATWTLTYGNSYMDGWTIMLQGRKGTMVLDDRGYRVLCGTLAQERPNTGTGDGTQGGNPDGTTHRELHRLRAQPEGAERPRRSRPSRSLRASPRQRIAAQEAARHSESRGNEGEDLGERSFSFKSAAARSGQRFL